MRLRSGCRAGVPTSVRLRGGLRCINVLNFESDEAARRPAAVVPGVAGDGSMEHAALARRVTLDLTGFPKRACEVSGVAKATGASRPRNNSAGLIGCEIG